MAKQTADPASFDKLYLNGEYVKSRSTGGTLLLRSPKDNSIVNEHVPIAGQEDVDVAVSFAEAALKGPWSTFTALQRTTALLKLNELVDERLVDLLSLDARTTGIPVSLIPTRERTYIRNGLLYFGKHRYRFLLLDLFSDQLIFHSVLAE